MTLLPEYEERVSQTRSRMAWALGLTVAGDVIPGPRLAVRVWWWGA